MARELGFELKMPYADRVDKAKSVRTMNFYCSMSKWANRRGHGRFDCPFRAVVKINFQALQEMAEDPELKEIIARPDLPEVERTQFFKHLFAKIHWEEVVGVNKLFWIHNHDMIDFSKMRPTKYSDSSNLVRLQKFFKVHVFNGKDDSKDEEDVDLVESVLMSHCS
mmetsp:Transcript_3670/g.5526  ORF Transcript_3670/g.5526 Transcript_3670/m.5526 type:complete len:166 (+) Transcript_3670:784-1281(+)|eukprot:CAMPEP_0170487374 /NCGR_PEP_ID=MMETSP0208-20121228/6208_1 /TAXON_ID=197538 /ORGANISM="Strombidium inclinatum, Strain S3" /LENGTH=165 /DNA_ID=CAMNT_0010761635 /DNA_START=716 /DNA_END=1213 /DNA_ORIENTATION=+